MRSDEYAETLQWNLCSSTVESVTAVVENGIPVAKFLHSSDVSAHDVLKKLRFEAISGIFQLHFSPSSCTLRLEPSNHHPLSLPAFVGTKQALR